MNKTIENLKKLKSFHNGSYGADIDKAIKALKTLEEFEKAQIITGGRLNGRTYAYKCGLEDGKRKALEQESVLDKIRAEILDEAISHSGTGEEVIQAYVDGLNRAIKIIDKYKAESEDKE